MQARKKYQPVDATTWSTFGDHVMVTEFSTPLLREAGYRCTTCNKDINTHGWLTTALGQGQIVCPGDWILTDTIGSVEVFKHDLFSRNYEII